jgi:hypothetical protein
MFRFIQASRIDYNRDFRPVEADCGGSDRAGSPAMPARAAQAGLEKNGHSIGFDPGHRFDRIEQIFCHLRIIRRFHRCRTATTLEI